MLKNFIFTSESVSEGHPDKVSDQISDAVLDACLEQDPKSRVACETLVNTGLVVLAGEITTNATFDYTEVARKTLGEIGYTDPAAGFSNDACAVMVTLDKQSPDIAQGVDEGAGKFDAQGAGDQGLMFGYACNDTDVLMPLPIVTAHRLVQKLAEVRKSGTTNLFYPDSKSQVTVKYEDNKPVHIDTVVVSTQHTAEATWEEINETVINQVIRPTLPQNLVDDNTRFLVNPTGRFVVGGPVGDCGLTGRKIIVDTYGGWGRHGGGAFSGKDPSKVDRSAAYYTRYVAKNIVAAGLATHAEVQVAYAIGVADPVSVLVDTFGTHTADVAKIEAAVREVFDFRPKAMIEQLGLLRPIYRPTAAYGHFGRTDVELPWEQTDRADALKSMV